MTAGMPRQATAIRAAAAVHPIPTNSETLLCSLRGFRREAIQFQFIHKPLFGLKYPCDTEATGILVSSQAEPAIRYALLSMVALREKYAKYGDYATIRTHHAHELRPVYESYNAAIGVLTRKLSHGGLTAAAAALQCCQLFISIECMQHNYAAAMQHLAQGLRIMRDWRIRAYIDEEGKMSGPVNSTLPQVDMFALKLFFAPCPGSRRMVEREQGNEHPRTSFQKTLAAMIEDPYRTARIRSGRSELHDIANGMFELLADATRSKPEVLLLNNKKAELLQQLDDWTTNTQNLRQNDGTIWPVRIDEVAMFLFHMVLRVIVISCIPSPGNEAAVEFEISNMTKIAEILTKIRSEDLNIL